jgi:hypothetical protein
MHNLHGWNKTKVNLKAGTNRTTKILLIGEHKNGALLNGQEGYHLFHCDTVVQAWDLVYRYRPHFIILNLDKSDRAALSDFQECRALAGDLPIIVAAPSHLRRPLMKALEHRALAVISTSVMRQGVGKVLHDLEVRPE